MLEELLCSSSRGGLILWALSGGKGSPVDALIRTCLLEERSAGGDGPGFTQDGKRALKWAFHNGLGLVFLAVYRRVLPPVRAEFARLYHPKRTTYDGFGDVFRQLHLEAQARAEEMIISRSPLMLRRPVVRGHNLSSTMLLMIMNLTAMVMVMGAGCLRWRLRGEGGWPGL